MNRSLLVLQSGKLVMIENRDHRKGYSPRNFSLRRVVRMLLKFQKRPTRRLHVASTTGGWEHFDTSRTVNTTCVCTWHREKYPERFEESYSAFSYPEPPREYSPE